MDFVRDRNGTIIGMVLPPRPHPAAHPDAATGEDPGHMVPIVGIPEGAIIGALPDQLTQADELGRANQKIAELEAALAALPAGSTATSAPLDPQAARIAELEAELAAKTGPDRGQTAEAPSSSSPWASPPVATPTLAAPGDTTTETVDAESSASSNPSGPAAALGLTDE